MPSIHDTAHRSDIVKRVQALRPDSQRAWGKMSVDQMLWHVSDALALALGELTISSERPPIPRGLLKFMVLNLPWGKNAPTHPSFVPKQNYDFQAERVRCLRLIEKLASHPIDGEWPGHPVFGPMRGRQISRLQAKHLNHHLKQFGV